MADEKAIPYLVKALGDKDESVRNAASEALTRIRGKAIQALEESVNNDDWHVREQVVEALGVVAEQRVMPFLTQALYDWNPLVRLRAVQSIEQVASQLDDEKRLIQTRKALKWRLTEWPLIWLDLVSGMIFDALDQVVTRCKRKIFRL